MGTGLKFLFEEEVTMRQGTNLGSQIGRWIILAALVALLGALLLTMRPVGAQDAPPLIPGAETVFNYTEKGTVPVTTYRARDPEGNKIFWTLSGTDAGVFSIDGGALRFKSPPDYENPTDGADPTTTPPAIEDNNIYRVTVRFGAGGEDGMPGADDYDGDDLGELDLTITVTNVNEDGRVYISSLQPQIGTELTATVTDLDGVAVPGSWQWARSDSENGPWENIPERSTDNTYRPVDADLNKYLQVTARYRDNVSGADAREESAVSAYKVRKDIVTSNDPPKFPDQSTLLTGVSSPTAAEPTQGRTSTERFIHEGSPAGTLVGAPVTAFDDATDIEVLTYSLSGTSADVDSFNIDPVTGQITVAAGARLNADVEDGIRGAADTPYEVTVTATDGDGDIQTIDVNIRVVRVDEPPKITAGPREMSHWESDRTPRSATRIDTDLDTSVLDYGENPPVLLTGNNFTDAMQDAIYTAMDPEDAPATLRWSLAGDDGDLFTITGNNEATDDRTDDGEMATLAFESGPDFEDEKDKNKDNVYEVTLVVTDSVGATGEYPVTVKVINSTDDNKPGKVRILNRVPEIATKLTATFEDPDKPTREVKWQWYRSVATSTNTNATVACPDSEDGDRYFIDTDVDPTGVVGGNGTVTQDGTVTESTIGWEKIPRAISTTYTPGYNEDSGGSSDVAETDTARTVTWTDGDIDVTIVTTFANDDTSTPESTAYTWTNFRCLRAAVTYRDAIDRTHREQDDPDTGVDETLEGAFGGSEYYVKRIDEENDAPEFQDAQGIAVSTYTAERREDTTGIATFTPPSDTPTLQVIEARPATDVMTGEDDASNNPDNSPTSQEADIRNSPGPGPRRRYPDLQTERDGREALRNSGKR